MPADSGVIRCSAGGPDADCKTVSPYLAPDGRGGLLWGQALIPGRLLERRRRFLAEVLLADGQAVTAHTPNTGRMTGCSQPGRPVWLSWHDNPGRKLKYTLEIIDMPGTWVGVNTNVPNRLVAEALRHGLVAPLKNWPTVTREVKVGPGSRLDLKLEAAALPPAFVEIKNCTLVQGRAALFPDAVTGRGLKHLGELVRLAGQGCKSVIFILVQRADGQYFSPADQIDPQWGRALREATRQGVGLLVYRALRAPGGLALGPPLPVKL